MCRHFDLLLSSALKVSDIFSGSQWQDMKETPFYGIPEHARPLLQAPTRILELQNVVYIIFSTLNTKKAHFALVCFR